MQPRHLQDLYGTGEGMLLAMGCDFVVLFGSCAESCGGHEWKAVVIFAVRGNDAESCGGYGHRTACIASLYI